MALQLRLVVCVLREVGERRGKGSRQALCVAAPTSIEVNSKSQGTHLATASPAAHARGFPPKVLAWSPGLKTLAFSCFCCGDEWIDGVR